MVLPSAPIRVAASLPHRRASLSAVAGVLAALALALLLISVALAGPVTFPDVPDDHPYAPAIAHLSSRGIIGGYKNGDFGLYDPVKRAQFAKMILGTLGIPPNSSTGTRFSDLGSADDDGYPHAYVQAAYDHGITYGTNADQTLFAPWNALRRDQVVSMIVRGAESETPGALEEPPATYAGSFPGVGDPHGPNLRIAEYNGLLDGLIRFGPDWVVTATATRGEVALMLHNLMALLADGTTTSTATTSTTEASTTTSSTITSSTTTSSTTTSTTSTTVAPQTGSLMHFDLTDGGGMGVGYVSNYTGAKIASPPVGWTEYPPSGVVGGKYHIAAASPSNDLLLFTRDRIVFDWSVENLSQKTGQKVQGAPTVWMSDTAVHLAVLSPSGKLLHFWQEQGKGFAVDNVTSRTGAPALADIMVPPQLLGIHRCRAYRCQEHDRRSCHFLGSSAPARLGAVQHQ